MKTILNKIRNLLNPPPRPPMRTWLPPEMVTVRLAEVKAGDTIVVSLPKIEIMDQAEVAKIEQSVRDELKMPEGVNVAVFFGQVDIYHLRKV